MRSESLVRCLLPLSVAGCRSALATSCSRCSEGEREVREGEARERRSREGDREVIIGEGDLGRLVWRGVISRFSLECRTCSYLIRRMWTGGNKLSNNMGFIQDWFGT